MTDSTLRTRLLDIVDGAAYDVIVLGAGGCGMAAALLAAMHGARVLVVESTRHVGGTTAFADGLAWIPGARHASPASPTSAAREIADARRYLDLTVGSRSSPALRDAFLRHGAAAIDQLERGSFVAWRAARDQPDHELACEGASAHGRVLEPLPFDARELGSDFALVRPPPPEAMGLAHFGGVMLDADDAVHAVAWRRSLRSFHHASGLALRLGTDRLRHARGTRLLRGNALVAQLLASLQRRQVALLTGVRATDLLEGPTGIDGVALVQEGTLRRVHARGGVVLATGGFLRHPGQRGARLADIDPDWSATAPEASGMGLSLAEARGAVFGTGALSAAYLAPVTLLRRHDGSAAACAHLTRTRRHVFVDAAGDCVLDAGVPHHTAALALHETMAMPVHLVTDARGLQTSGLGWVGPGGRGLRRALAEGLVRRAADLRELAAVLQVPSATLEPSLRAHLARAFAGQGRVAFTPPYYAVEVHPGDIAAASGLATDENARVLDARAQPLPGLYAVGGDMHSVMGGVLPAPGCMLGPGLVFAAIAAAHATTRAVR